MRIDYAVPVGFAACRLPAAVAAVCTNVCACRPFGGWRCDDRSTLRSRSVMMCLRARFYYLSYIVEAKCRCRCHRHNCAISYCPPRVCVCVNKARAARPKKKSLSQARQLANNNKSHVAWCAFGPWPDLPLCTLSETDCGRHVFCTAVR